MPKPNVPRVGVSTSAYIDTLRPSDLSRVSEIKSAVINTGYRGGNFVLNLHHVPLSDEERERRGGDKVKILGISSC